MARANPCPFPHEVKYGIKVKIDPKTEKSFVLCLDGGCCGPSMDSKELAIAAWNTRPRPDAGEAAMHEAKVWDGFLIASVQGICHAYNVPTEGFIPKGDRSADDWGGIVQSIVEEVITLRKSPPPNAGEEVDKPTTNPGWVREFDKYLEEYEKTFVAIAPETGLPTYTQHPDVLREWIALKLTKARLLTAKEVRGKNNELDYKKKA